MTKEEYKDLCSEGKQRIESVTAYIATQDTVLFGILCMVDKNPSNSYKTIGVKVTNKNRPPTIEFNPHWVKSVGNEILEAVLVQESFKILLKHVTSRFLDPKDLSKLASQLSATELLNKTNMHDSVYDEFMKDAPSPKDFDLPEMLSLEDYQNRLFDKASDAMDKLKSMFNQGQGSSASGSSSGSGDEDGDEDGDGSSSSGSGNGNEDGEDSGQGNPNKYKNQEDAIKEYHNPMNGDADGWGNNSLFDSEVKSFVDSHKGSSKKWGKYTGGAMDLIIAAHDPKISFREILRRFSTSVTKTQSYSSRMKRNRRYGLAIPGHKRKEVSKIIFAIDSSGSMSDRQLSHGIAVMNQVCKHSEVEYVVFDTEIKDQGPFKKAVKEFKVAGRGGTDFQCICDYASEQKVDGLVIFTDGYASPPTRPSCKVMWLLTNKDENPPVEWGFRAHLEIDE